MKSRILVETFCNTGKINRFMGIKKASLTEICRFVHNNKINANLSDTLLIHINHGHAYADHLYGDVYLVAIVKECSGLTYATINDIKANKYIGAIVDISNTGKMNILKPIKLNGHLNPPVFFKSLSFRDRSDTDVLQILKSYNYNVNSFVKLRPDILRADFDYTN